MRRLGLCRIVTFALVGILGLAMVGCQGQGSGVGEEAVPESDVAALSHEVKDVDSAASAESNSEASDAQEASGSAGTQGGSQTDESWGPEGEGAEAEASAADVAAADEEARVIKVACVGDSITQGMAGTNYPDVLAGYLGKGYAIANYGVAGSTVARDGSFPYSSYPEFFNGIASDADVVVLMLGTNDSNDFTWKGADHFREQYAQLVSDYLTMDSAPRVVLCTPPSAFDSADGNVYFEPEYAIHPERFEDIMGVIRDVAAENGLEVVDVNAATAGHPEWYVVDGVHPNDEGAQVIAQVIGDAVRG